MTDTSTAIIITRKSTVFVSRCEENWTRFGDGCYRTGDSTGVVAGENSCLDMGGHIWGPESSQEMKWVAKILGEDEDMYLGPFLRLKKHLGGRCTYYYYLFLFAASSKMLVPSIASTSTTRYWFVKISVLGSPLP